jgi:hypothetical protein
MVNVGISYDHFKYFMAIGYNLWQFNMYCGYLLYFSQFGMFGPGKIWQPWMRAVIYSADFFPAGKKR